MCKFCDVPVGVYIESSNIADSYIRKSLGIEPFLFTDWIILQEEKVELSIIKWLDEQKNLTLEALDDYYGDIDIKKILKVLKKNKADLIIIAKKQIEIYEFDQFIFQKDLDDKLIKANSSAKYLKYISEINSDPFTEILNKNTADSLRQGGQSSFASFGINLQFNMRDKLIEDAMRTANLKLSKEVKKSIQTRIRSELYNGIINGEDIAQLRKRVLNVYNNPITVKVPPKLTPDGEVIKAGYSYPMAPKDWAAAVAGTEVTKAFMEGKLEGYKQFGIVTKVEFVITPDERLCERCEPLGGNIYKLEEASGIIPVHPRCRCTLIPVIDNEKLNKDNIGALRTSIVNSYYSDLDTSLKTVENNIANLSKEELYVLDDSGKIINNFKGTKGEVKIPKNYNTERLRNKIATHNHPNQKVGFSPDDFAFAIETDLKEFRVVAGDEVHIFTRPNNGWKLKENYDYSLDEFYSFLTNINNDVRYKISLELAKGSVSWDNAQKKLSRVYYKRINEIFKKYKVKIIKR